MQPRSDANFDLYPYTPSAVAGWIFVVIFAVGGLIHLGLLITLRSWFFIPLILGCAGEAGGYYGRAWSHSDIRSGSPYLLQLILILGSAPLISATIYMTLGRLIRALDGVDKAVIRPSWTTKIYVLIDIASFVCQIIGSAMQASGDPKGMKTANTIVLGGLGIQLFGLVTFVIMAAVFHTRLNRKPTEISYRRAIRWTRYLGALYLASILVLVRNVFRFIDFATGSNGPIYKTEAYLYIFDASFMAIVVFVMALQHNGFLFRTIRQTLVHDNKPRVMGIYY